jgi:ectoine hydroxylase-related dioxygenase (phytanoyl-CoA dioxygenase family)
MVETQMRTRHSTEVVEAAEEDASQRCSSERRRARGAAWVCAATTEARKTRRSLLRVVAAAAPLLRLRSLPVAVVAEEVGNLQWRRRGPAWHASGQAH